MIGLLNWPNSMLAWDVIMLNGYLVLNLAIPFYILYSHFVGREPSKKKYVPLIYISVIWAVSIHLVTAFLFAGLPARPFWNSAAAGAPLPGVRVHRRPCVHDPVARVHPDAEQVRHPGQVAIQKLATATTVAAQVNLVMLLSELVYEFYMPTHHGISARYLFFGLGEHHGAGAVDSGGDSAQCRGDAYPHDPPAAAQPTRWLMPACAALFVGIWVEKGIGIGDPGLRSLATRRDRRVHPHLGRAVRDGSASGLLACSS